MGFFDWLSGRKDPDTDTRTGQRSEALDAALEQKYATLGRLEEGVFARMAPVILDDQLVMWPANAIGRIRLIRKERSLLFLTHGLSFPFEASLHPDPPDPLGYELAVEVAANEAVAEGEPTFGKLDSDQLGATWPVYLLWFLADAWVHDRWDLRPRLDQFGLLTSLCGTVPQPLHRLRREDGLLGLLVGRPFGEPGDEILPQDARLVMLQTLHAEEHQWCIGVNDAARAVALSGRLDTDGVGALSSRTRPLTPELHD